MYLKVNLFIILLFSLSNVCLSNPDDFDQNSYNSCKPPYSVRVKNTGLDYAVITWKSTSNSIAWKIKWRKEDRVYEAGNISSLIDSNEYKIIGLEANTKYFFQIKTICDEDNSNWSNEYSFITNLTNPSDCELHFTLKDKNSSSPGKTYFTIQNDKFADKQLGVNLFIQNIKLIVQHTWTSDLEINLTSPSGNKITLTSSNGLNNGLGYGNAEDSTCSQTVIFSDDACNSIKDNIYPFIGLFKPEESISKLYDSISPVGKWQLEIIDKLKGNSGFLEYVEIDFEPIICPVPKMISLIPLNDTSVFISWKPDNNIDSILIDLNNSDTDINIFNNNSYILSGLESYDSINISLMAKCGLNISAESCPKTIQLLCSEPDLREGFDEYNLSNCEDDCLNSEIWYNLTSKEWLVNSGETTTENTGPYSDKYGYGNYLYLESSAIDEDEDTIAILQSECIDIKTQNDCNMSFYYNMYGIDIGSLMLSISNDGGLTWNSLFYTSGNHGNNWIFQEIDLNNYAGYSCIFRFTGKTLKNKNYGDIAIDDIIIYNASLTDPEEHLYYPDRDNDGFGKDTSGTFFCIKPDILYVNNNFDCDDNNEFINPDAEEILCNFIDENCNGMEDDAGNENPFDITLESISDESCEGRSDGEIIISIKNGIPPYYFQWSNNSTDSILSNVGSGLYWCKITDQSGCGIISDTFEITHSNPIQLQIIDLIKPGCDGSSDGMINIDQTGGIAPYSYKWSNGDTIQNPKNLSSGIYSVTITDSLGCKLISPDIQLDAENIFNIGIIQKINPGCYGSDNGKISLYVTGGTPPYKYNWNTGDTEPAINNLTDGDYYCTITDAALCYKVFGPVSLKQPDSLKASINALDNVTCIGEENGLIEIKTTGGTPPYSFIWSNYAGDYINLSDDIYNLKAGIYKVRIFDSKGCQKTLDSIRINTLDSIALRVDSIRHVNCSGTIDGYIQVSAYNGYGQYYYFWNTGDDYTDHIDSLSTGVYGITATDDFGCKQILNNIEVKNLNIPLQIDIRQLDTIYCYNDKSASIEANVISGNFPFDFNWSAGVKNITKYSADTLKGLDTGDYNVTVTDSKGCTGYSEYISIDQPSALEISDIIVDEILCFNENSGKIYLEIQGGTPEYKVIWNDPAKTGKEIIKLKSGIYQATVTDRNDCQLITNEIFLDQPEELKVTIISNPAHKNTADGSAKILVTGGVSPYFFQWDENAGNQTGNKAIDLYAGQYNVSLTDYNDCFKLVKVSIGEITGTDENIANNINIYPNPAKNSLYITGLDIKNTGLFLINITGTENELKYNLLHDKILIADIDDFSTGTYILKIKSGSNTYFKKIIILK